MTHTAHTPAHTAQHNSAHAHSALLSLSLSLTHSHTQTHRHTTYNHLACLEPPLSLSHTHTPHHTLSHYHTLSHNRDRQRERERESRGQVPEAMFRVAFHVSLKLLKKFVSRLLVLLIPIVSWLRCCFSVGLSSSIVLFTQTQITTNCNSPDSMHDMYLSLSLSSLAGAHILCCFIFIIIFIYILTKFLFALLFSWCFTCRWLDGHFSLSLQIKTGKTGTSGSLRQPFGLVE